MFKRVERLVDWWIRTGAAQEEDREVLAYGADLALYTAASTGALLLTGLVWGRWWEAAVIIACFYLNQTNGGGFHAASHGKCFGTMWLGLVDAVARRRLRPARFRHFPSGCLRSGKKNRPRSQLKIFCTKIEPPKSMAARKTNPISARSHRRFFARFPQYIGRRQT